MVLFLQIHEHIRKHDDETLIFWEPNTWGYGIPAKYDPEIDDRLERLLSGLTIMDFLPILEIACDDLNVRSKGV